MNLPKFIITIDGYFRLGMVNQHKDLLKPGEQCIGGGYYTFDYVSNRIVQTQEHYQRNQGTSQSNTKITSMTRIWTKKIN